MSFNVCSISPSYFPHNGAPLGYQPTLAVHHTLCASSIEPRPCKAFSFKTQLDVENGRVDETNLTWLILGWKHMKVASFKNKMSKWTLYHSFILPHSVSITTAFPYALFKIQFTSQKSPTKIAATCRRYKKHIDRHHNKQLYKPG